MTVSSPEARSGLLQRTFRSLRVYNYRLYFFSQVVSMSGTWMQSVAQNWLVLSLTSSALDVGITVGLQFGPVLFFGAWGGTLADRVDKRRLLIVTQAGAAILALALGILAATGVVTVWMIWVLAALTGTTTALGIPALQSFLYEMVGPDDLANAVGLNSVVINISRIVGPLDRRGAHRRLRAGALLLLQRCFVPRGDRRPRAHAGRRTAPGQARLARARAGARRPQVCLAHPGAAHPADHAGRHQHPGLQLLGRAAAADQERVRPRRRLLWDPLRRHGCGGARGRPVHGEQGAPLTAPARGRRLRLRRGHRRSGARTRLLRRARVHGPHRRRRRAVHQYHQRPAAAERRRTPCAAG